ncbi:hypothetical protein BJ741DRAFT_634992 [Chytriomyces cf. hyalinus JEL632]|nr:hypothetical protein BJ741DRAFT_634992 [Chytriomyces cf. hyalinus JEL632]
MRHPIPPPQSLHARHHARKGDAEIPTAIELAFLEIKAAFQTRQDREKRQTWHQRIVEEMRQELVRERRLDVVTAAHDLGYTTSVDSVETEDAEQDAKQREQNAQEEQQDAGLRVFLHNSSLEDLDDAVFSSELAATNADRLFKHGNSAVLGSSTFQNHFNQPDLASTGVASSIDVVSFSSFEELLNHFPCASLT